jgi:hypothetical protein
MFYDETFLKPSPDGARLVHDRRRPGMTMARWLLQMLLTALFLAHGGFMVTPPAAMVAMRNANLEPRIRVVHWYGGNPR